ncbi:MAG TPA: NfeD family protein [Gemmatimonadaceae bacterium]|nr:NfeD family protein [Gemmatimonadaceae bacterium]
MKVAIGLLLIAVIAAGVLFMIHGIGLFAPSKRPRVQEDPEVITGLVARVTVAIAADTPGRVAYTLEGSRYEVNARSVDGRAMASGTDVVIERIEGGTAFVERWEVVEGRL